MNLYFRPLSKMFLLYLLINPLIAQGQTSCMKGMDLFSQAGKLNNSAKEKVDLYRQSVELCPSFAEGHYNLGILLKQNGKLQESLLELQKAVLLKDTVEFQIALSSVELETGQTSQAIDRLQKLLTRDNNNPRIKQALVAAYQKNGEPDKAQQILSESKIKGLDQAESEYKLGLSFLKAKQFEKAILAFKHSLELDPEIAETQFQLGRTYRLSNKFDLAEEALQAALELDPGNSDVKRELGILYQTKQDYHKAEEILVESVEENVSDPELQVELAATLMGKKQYKEAEVAAQKAVNLDSENVRALNILGWSKLEQGELDSAERFLLSARDLDRDNAAVRNNLGLLYMKRGRKEEAEEEFKKALVLDPGFKRAKENLRVLTEE